MNEENFDYLDQFNIVELKAIVRARTLQLHATIKEIKRLEKLIEEIESECGKSSF